MPTQVFRVALFKDNSFTFMADLPILTAYSLLSTQKVLSLYRSGPTTFPSTVLYYYVLHKPRKVLKTYTPYPPIPGCTVVLAAPHVPPDHPISH
jgi:hypothetical protein